MRASVSVALALFVLVPAARASPPEYTLADALVLPPSPSPADSISLSYLVFADNGSPQSAGPTEVRIVGNDIAINVFVAPGAGLPFGENQIIGPVPPGTYAWVIRVFDTENFEIDDEKRGEILVLDDEDPGGGTISLVLDHRSIEVTDGDCQQLPCRGETILSAAPAPGAPRFSDEISAFNWYSSLFSTVEVGGDQALFSAISFTDSFASTGTGRAVFDIVFRVREPLAYRISGDFEIDIPKVGNGLTRFELRRVASGQSFAPLVGFTLEGPFAEQAVEEEDTLTPGLYQLLAVGAGCCGGADADWGFEMTVPAPTHGESFLAITLSLAAMASARRRSPASGIEDTA